MKNHVTFNCKVKSRLNWFCIGKGAKLNLKQATYPLLHFTWQSYLRNQDSVSGDINLLKELIGADQILNAIHEYSSR